MFTQKKTLWFVLVSLFVFLVFACLQGPPGANGVDGNNGENGINGTNGVDGIDGKNGIDGINGKDAVLDSALLHLLTTSTGCRSCHNENTLILSKQMQWANSGHATKGDFNQSGAACASCHTHEGFKADIANGEDTLTTAILDPTPQNCRTCHMIHTSFDSTDWKLRLEGNVTIKLTQVEHGFGKGAVCATCHQPRTNFAPPTLASTDSITITSNRFGPHHGVEAALLVGTAGYEIDGLTTYRSSKHLDELRNGCVECHMGNAVGDVAGGHQLGYRYNSHGTEAVTVASCLACHKTITTLNYRSVQTKTDSLVAVLQSILKTKGAVDSVGNVVTGKYAAKVVGALWNLQLIKNDGSKGVHNYPYMSALLKNSIDGLK